MARKKLELCREAERMIITTYRKRIWNPFVKALKEYELVCPGDKIAVCISGGKDSFLLAKCMQQLQKVSEIKFELKFCVMDPGYSDENLEKVKQNAEKLGIPIEIFESDIFDAVFQIEKSPCYVCARMRRGHLYAKAKELNCNKIALGHHFDDVVETVLLSMLYNGQFSTMMPKLHSKNFEGLELVRPLYLVKETDIIAWGNNVGLEFLQCACKFTENENEMISSKRQEIKEIIQLLRKINPDFDKNIFKSTSNVRIDTILGFKKQGVLNNFLDDY